MVLAYILVYYHAPISPSSLDRGYAVSMGIFSTAVNPICARLSIFLDRRELCECDVENTLYTIVLVH
jgi:hypothetical protein